jgi:hypothetical protein
LEKNFLTSAASPVRRDRESIRELVAYGFQPTQGATGDEARLICFEGELKTGFANGVEYHLRFGDITGKGRGAEAQEGEKADAAKGDEAKGGEATDGGAAKGSNTAPNRYLMVTARFNESLIPKPKLEELPPETPAATTPPAATDKPKTDEKKDESKSDAPKTPTKVEPDDAGGCEDQEPAADEKKADDKKAEDKKPAEDAKPAMTPEERNRIKTENETKQKEYEEKIKAGREKAKELNAKFAEWFYVISDSTYKGLDVDPTGLIRKNTSTSTGSGSTPPATPGLPNLDLLPTMP